MKGIPWPRWIRPCEKPPETVVWKCFKSFLFALCGPESKEEVLPMEVALARLREAGEERTKVDKRFKIWIRELGLD